MGEQIVFVFGFIVALVVMVLSSMIVFYSIFGAVRACKLDNKKSTIVGGIVVALVGPYLVFYPALAIFIPGLFDLWTDTDKLIVPFSGEYFGLFVAFVVFNIVATPFWDGVHGWVKDRWPDAHTGIGDDHCQRVYGFSELSEDEQAAFRATISSMDSDDLIRRFGSMDRYEQLRANALERLGRINDAIRLGLP